MHKKFLAGSALLLLLTSACGPTVTLVVQQYPGPARERTEVAVIRIESDQAAQLAAVDREPLGKLALKEDTRLHVELLPGEHTLDIRHPKKTVDATQVVRFKAEAGAVYSAFLDERDWYRKTGTEPQPGAWTALVYEIDGERGTRLREVSLPR
jgi:hypothetical protein